MNLSDVYIKSLEGSKAEHADRQGLYTALKACMGRARRPVRLSAEEFLSKQLTYEGALRRFAERVRVEFDGEGFHIIPSPETDVTYKELKYGAMWYEIDDDVDAIVTAKIFWGAGT